MYVDYILYDLILTVESCGGFAVYRVHRYFFCRLALYYCHLIEGWNCMKCFSRIFLVVLAFDFSQVVLAGGLTQRRALEGSQRGRLCQDVVTELLSARMGEKVQLLSFENLTPGSHNQEYEAKFSIRGNSKTAQLTGNYDCDDLKIQSIQ